MPLLPAGVRELKFSEFYQYPVGPRGLEPTDKLKQLNGGKVRILSYMARQTEPWTNAFLLTPVPVQLHERRETCSRRLPPRDLLMLPIAPNCRGFHPIQIGFVLQWAAGFIPLEREKQPHPVVLLVDLIFASGVPKSP